VGEYADTLRALGRYLDQLGASEITIIEEPPNLGVVWKGRGSTREARVFGGAQLHALRITARMFRGLEGAAPRLVLGELLRTLGSVVDESRATGVIITETAGGFRLSALSDGQELSRAFAYSEIVALGQERDQQRTDGLAAHAPVAGGARTHEG
jgi:hypothetical protein